MIYFCSPSLTITLKNQDGVKTTKILHYQDKNGTKLTSEVPDIKPPQEYGIADVVSAQEIFYAAYEGGTMYAFFTANRPETGIFTVYCLTYNPADSNNGAWAKFELNGLGVGTNCSYQNTVFCDKKLYLAAVDDLVVLDISENKITKLSSITEKAKKIIPNSSWCHGDGVMGGVMGVSWGRGY